MTNVWNRFRKKSLEIKRGPGSLFPVGVEVREDAQSHGRES